MWNEGRRLTRLEIEGLQHALRQQNARVAELEAYFEQAVTLLEQTTYAEDCPPLWSEKVAELQRATKEEDAK